MSNIIDKVKEELKRKKEELEKSKSKNYAKNYYKEISTSLKGNQMIAVITGENNYKYVSRGEIPNQYDLVGSMISGITGETVERDKSIEDLSREYNYIIITANPSINNEPTTIYTPENLEEFQKAELADFERQVEEYNKEYKDNVLLQKVVVNNKTTVIEENGMSK